MTTSPQPVRVGRREGQRPAPTRPPTVTLSAENAPTRSRPAPAPCPAASGALRAADGPPQPFPPSSKPRRLTVRCAAAR
jgi:hypothetical protein